MSEKKYERFLKVLGSLSKQDAAKIESVIFSIKITSLVSDAKNTRYSIDDEKNAIVEIKFPEVDIVGKVR